MEGNGKNCWVVTLNSELFVSVGLPWIYHAKRYPGIRLFVADAGLEIGHRQKLLEEKVGIIVSQTTSHFGLWAGMLNSQITEGTILYTSAIDMSDPVALFDRGADKMVFGKWPVNTEYYNLCRPLVSIADQARMANYLEEKVSKKLDGIAAPVRLCGPAYFWKVMVGLAHAVRSSQPYHNSYPWEPLAANIFAATYPEYTVLE